MGAQLKLFNWRIGTPFFVAPGNGCLPSLRQWIYFLVGSALLLTVARPYFQLATSRDWIAAGRNSRRP